MTLSVVMCTYNGEKYIKEQIESILKQTVPVDEIIICDDNSNDKTVQMIEEIQQTLPNKIKIFKNPINLGSNKNFEKAITFCTGDYIFLSDQDDLWKKNKVEKIINYFEENTSLEGVFSNGDLINNKGDFFTKNSLWDSVFFIENQLKKPIDLFSLIKSKRNMVTGATLCFKKEVKDLILPIPDIKKYYHDEWIAIIIASRNKLSYITDNLISYRIHSEQQIGGKISISKEETQKHLKFSNFILENTIPKSYIDFKQLAKIYYRHYLKYKNVAENISDDFHLNFKAIASANFELFLKNKKSLKKNNPLRYYFNSIIDKIRGKRQLK
jgi:glycosyltransferase involved in cell wall biosynthesis